jgi:hypothetical protein
MDAKFINASGTVRDYFTLLKQSPPVLSIERTNSHVSVSWARESGPFLLEKTLALSNAAAWTAVSPPYTTGEARIKVTLPITPTNTFYRLKK